METVLVTQSEYAKGQAVFQAATAYRFEPVAREEETLAAAVRARKARAVVVGVHPYAGPLYDALAETAGGQGALLARFGVGHDSVDKRRASALGILVTNTPGVLDQSVAEHAIWLMGALARRIPAGEADLRGGAFQAAAGIELSGLTLGVLGFGAIGRRVAAIAHFGLAMRVLAVDQRPLDDLQRDGLSLVDLKSRFGIDDYLTEAERVVAASDVLSVHLPATSATRHFINAARLSAMRPNCLLVNTARGSIVDESALFDALSAGRIAGAALDVFETEPYAPVVASKDLRQLKNVVLTPHVGSNTLQANRRMAEAVVANVAHFLAGRHDALTRVPMPA